MEQFETIEGFRLSPQQHRLWQLRRDPTASRAQCSLLVEGPLDPHALSESLSRLVLRHEVLRTAFRLLPYLDVPLQAIAGPYPVELRQVEYATEEGSALEDTLSRLCARERAAEFAFERGEVMRAVLARLGGGRHMLVLTLPSLCADSASLVNIFRQLSQLYDAGPRSQPSGRDVVQYADFSEWQNELLDSPESLPRREFWKSRLRLSAPPVRLPLERPAGDDAVRPELKTLTVTLGRAVADGLENLARERTLSTGSLLLACWLALLWRLTAEPEVSVGVAFDGRKFSRLASAVGPFGKYIPISVELAADLHYAELASAVEEATRAAHAHQEHFMPAGVRQAGEQEGRDETVGFDYEQWPEDMHGGGLRWRLTSLSACPEPFKLRLSVGAVAGSLRLTFYYDPRRFEGEAIARLCEQYRTLMGAAVESPDVPLSALALLGERERHQLLVEWQGAPTPFQHERCLHQLIEEQAERTPHRIAIVYENEELSYAALNGRANQLAHHLRARGVGPDSLVGIMTERSVEMVVAVLGVLKAGGAYVPLDPAYPQERISFMLEDAAVAFLLTQRRLPDGLPPPCPEVIALDSEWETISRRSAGNPHHLASPGGLAYVIYTSGSTGRPKGVMIQHRSVLNLLAALEQTIYSGHPEVRRVSVNAPLSFDASVKQLIQLARGRTLCVVPEWVRRDGAALRRYVSRQRVDLLDCTPAQLRLMHASPDSSPAGAASPEEGGHYPRVALVGGEAIDPQLWRRLAADTHTAYYNVYGPTECTVDATCARVSPQLAVPTIGRPLPNVRILILDARGQPAPAGVVGELCIGGEGVARGYLRREQLTGERFVADPFSDEGGARLYRTGDLARHLADGQIEYAGRVDRQVKLRGYRVELGEVEAVIAGHPGVRECAVVAREDEPGDRRLVAYVVPCGGPLTPPVRDGRQARYRLPNGLEVAHHNHNETAYLYEEIFTRRAYLRHGVTLPAGACVFDVGANIGMFTLFARAECPTARVHAFEPLGAVCETLRANAALLGGGVKVYGHGLADSERNEEFTFYERYTMMSGASAYAYADSEVEVIKSYLRRERQLGVEGASELLAHSEALLEGRFEGKTERCRLRRLAEVLREERITEVTLLKVDVQRAESEVLAGIDEGQWRGIRQVVMEVHDGEGEASEGRCAEIRGMLEERGYLVTVEQEEELLGTDRYNLYAVQADWDGTGAGERGGAAAEVEVAQAAETGAGVVGLREYVRACLPEYMAPAAYVELERLPLTRHGKVDWQALPAPGTAGRHSASTFVAPENEVEEIIADIWRKVLRVEKVSCDENFFDIGGHSLLIVQVSSHLREALKRDVPIVELFNHPTIKSLARHLSRESVEAVSFAGIHERTSRREIALRRQRQFMEGRRAHNERP